MAKDSLVRLTELSPHLWHLVFNRPSYHNAFNTAFAKQLIEHCRNISQLNSDENRQKRVVLISGQGRSFCSGADLKERQSIKSKSDWMNQHHIFEDMFNAVAHLPQPTIACVEGFALAGGFELALNCDLIVASRTASFGLPEVTRGIMPGGGGTQLLTRLIGPARAKQITLTGRRITADEAFHLGIAQILTDENQALEKGIELAKEIAANAPLAVRAIKRSIDDGWGETVDRAKLIELKFYETLIETEDRLEGIDAFNQKRKPQWKAK